MSKTPSLSKLLHKGHFPEITKAKLADEELQRLQLAMLRVQQGVWNQKHRVIIALEGFDASGKGGAIRRLTEDLDPRSFQVHPIGPPTADEQGKHYLYRFWGALPSPGKIAIFDRTWYGRVLVERVEKLVPKNRWQAAFHEIRQFEKMLVDDGIQVIKIFLGISAREQLRRFEDRLKDPYKQWKLGEPDIEARARWDDYVKATDEAFKETHVKESPWHLIPADHKDYARIEVLRTVSKRLHGYHLWTESRAQEKQAQSLKKSLKELSRIK